MTEKDYMIIYVRTNRDFCLVEKPGNFENEGDLSGTISVSHRYPKNLVVDLARDGGDTITDFINNIFRILIVSQKARTILELKGIKDDLVEYLPIVLRDKKKKIVEGSFFIVNVLMTFKCFDWERSIYKTYTMRPDVISPSSLRILHLNVSNISPDAKLFRVGEITKELIIRTDLLETFKHEGCEGLCVIPIGEKRI